MYILDSFKVKQTVLDTTELEIVVLKCDMLYGEGGNKFATKL